MEAMKDTISSWLKSFKDYINSFSFVEKEKNIFYFSKFSLDISEFFLIHDFIKKLKENIFKENMEQFKYCVKNIIIFTDQNNNKVLNEKEKIIILFSACLFIYYKKFRFNINCSFDAYFDNEFIIISKNIFKFEIKNNEIFKIFAFYYFSIMQKQIQALDYTKIKNIKRYYNFSALEKKEEKEEENVNMINGSSQKVNEGFQDQVLTFLISAKEKMLELVYITNKNQNNINGPIPEEIKDMNSRFQKLNNNLNIYVDNNDNKINNKNNINKINDSYSEDNKSDMTIEENIPQKPKNFNMNMKNIASRNNKNDTSLNSAEKNNINIFGNETHSNKLSLMQTDFSNNNHINFINENTFNIDANKNIINNPIIERNNSMNLSNKSNPLFYNFDLNISNFNSNSFSLEKSFDSLFNISPNNNNLNDINNLSSNIHSKKIVSELIKSEFDKETMEIIDHVAKVIDEKYLDSYLNTSQKTVCLIQYFCCYIVDFTPEMLQNMCPEYKDILKNFDIKFIVLAKELYNITMEIFSTIYDLSYTNFDTFIELTKDCGIQLVHAQGLYKIFREYSIMLLNEKKKKKNINTNSNKYTMSVLRKLFDNEYQNWTNIIKQKSNEFITFVKM